MDIGVYVADALAGIIDVYDIGINFGNNAPETYAIYNYTESGAEYAEGKHNSLSYFITISVFSGKIQNSLYTKIRKALENNRCSYIGGGRVDTSLSYPDIVQYHLDFALIDSGGDVDV